MNASMLPRPAAGDAVLQGDDRAVILYSGPEEARAAAQDVFGNDAVVRRVDPEREAVVAGLSVADAFLDASMKVRVDAAMIAAAPRLRIVVVAATGADHIDALALRARGIPLVTLRGREVLRNLTPAAEHSWLLAMACARHLRGAIDHALAAQWDRTAFPGMMLRGRTIGIVGMGRIGRWMVRYAEAFGMRTLGCDPVTTDWPSDTECLSLDELLPRADIVTLHVPLTSENVGFFDRRCFESMRHGALFVNTSRGDLVDEGALLEALESGRVAAAGLDVLKGEPEIRDHPLRLYAQRHTNLIITPHIGGFSLDAVRVVVRHSAELIRDQRAAVHA